MLDYRGIEALHTVLELQSFEKAAKKLHITQSAVTQRIKGLESYYGEPLLVRTLPYKPTRLAEHLVGHFKKISLLESSVQSELTTHKARTAISIAINRDSLEMWFIGAFEHVCQDVQLEIIADDQDLTIDYLKRGQVAACLSTCSKPLSGAHAVHVGDMPYLFVATPEFVQKYRTKKKNWLLDAPILRFDAVDFLQDRYMEKFLHYKGELTYHTVPSVRGFKQYVLQGKAAGLIPRIDIRDELESKKLVQVCDKIWNVQLYWHYWDIESKPYKKFNSDLIAYAKKALDPHV